MKSFKERERIDYICETCDLYEDLEITEAEYEGKKVKLLLKQSIDKTIRDILGGVRSSCTYVGAPSLKQLSKCTTFVRVNNQFNDTFGKS